MTSQHNRLPFFKNVFDSGIVEIWFSALGYALVTAGFLFLSYDIGVPGAELIAVISYLFVVVKVTHGTRKPYNYLKDIYVHSNPIWVSKFLLKFSFLIVRIQVFVMPAQIYFLTKNSGKLPI